MIKFGCLISICILAGLASFMWLVLTIIDVGSALVHLVEQSV